MVVQLTERETLSDLVSNLKDSASSTLSLSRRISLCEECIRGVADVAEQWAEEAVSAKGLSRDSSLRAEDLLSGPGVVARQLRLTIQTLNSLARHGCPKLPLRCSRLSNGQTKVPVFPTSGYFDSLTFMGMSGHVRMHPGISAADIHGGVPERVQNGNIDGLVVVLGAGNVSSIPATDSLSKIMFEGRRVILKMNPVNEYLAPIFERAFAGLISSDLLRIVTGGAEVGEQLINHPDVDEVHITGSADTHDAIVWGPDKEEREQLRRSGSPALAKTITSELGNVTPWIVAPGAYSARQLHSQAKHLAVSITNNASFNCLATKAIVTWDKWSQRDEFLDLINHYLAQTPRRPAYYPGAAERFRRYTGSETQPDEHGTLPWALLDTQSFDERPELFREESFVCVCAETCLAADSPEAFLMAAADFVNDQMAGTLCASITMPNGFRRQHSKVVEDCLQRLRYGSVCINQWSGLAYGFISPPWGAYPGATLEDVQSGIGSVHNTYLLEGFEKTVLEGPLVNFPKPVWFPDHRNAVSVATKLLELYHRPSPVRLPGLLVAALMG